MSFIAFLTKESKVDSGCEITKLSQNIYLDEEGNAQVGLELILNNNNDHTKITGIQIVVPQIRDAKSIIDKSKTLLDPYNPWNKRYTNGYELLNSTEGHIILDGMGCHVIGFKDKEDIMVNESYGDIEIINIDFKKIAEKGFDNIPQRSVGVFRMIIPFKDYTFGIEDAWCCSAFLYQKEDLPDSFTQYLKDHINQIIKINKKPCDLHIILPPHMVCHSTIPNPAKVTGRSYELFEKAKLEQKREGVTWRARFVLEKETHLQGEVKDEGLSWTGMTCYCNYWKPITREWLTNVIKMETKNVLGEYTEKYFQKFKQIGEERE